MQDILLTGANGVVGSPLKKRLELDEFEVHCVSRDLAGSDEATAIHWDLLNQAPQTLIDRLKDTDLSALIHCAPIWLLPMHLETISQAGIRRLVVFSSSSVISKRASSDLSENHLVRQLFESEEAIKKYCAEMEIALTIFRPSLIYGYGRDQNITRIARFIKRYRIMLLVGKAKGLRQPVHANDLVEACLSVLNNSASFGKTYHLAGAEVLSYRVMIERIFNGLEQPQRIISLPLGVFRFLLKMAALIGRFSYTPEMADRMNQDLNYDNTAAQQDFAYAPQAFLSAPKRDLP